MGQAEHPLFRGLNDVDAATARRRCERRSFSSGERIFHHGDEADFVVLLLDGQVHVEVDHVLVGTLGAGGVLGEMGLFEAGRRKAHAFAHSNTEALVLSRTGYEELRDTMHPMAMNLERHALGEQLRHLRRVSDRIGELADGTEARIVVPRRSFFTEVARLFGRSPGAEAGAVSRKEALRRSPLFEDVPTSARNLMAARMKAVRYPPGHFLCTEGETGTEMFLLVKGSVEVIMAVGGTQVECLATLEPGAAFGMVSLAEGTPRMASCVASDMVDVLSIDRATFLDLALGPYLEASSFRRAMLRNLTAQLQRSNDRLAAYTHATGEYPVLRPLLEAASALTGAQ